VPKTAATLLLNVARLLFLQLHACDLARKEDLTVAGAEAMLSPAGPAQS